jgi:hypothetical protein
MKAQEEDQLTERNACSLTSHISKFLDFEQYCLESNVDTHPFFSFHIIRTCLGSDHDALSVGKAAYVHLSHFDL